MRFGFVILGCALLTGATSAQTTDERSKLSGTWEALGGSSEKWIIEEKPDAVHMSHAVAAEKPAEVECNTRGRDCEWKHDGKKATVSMYFNGPKLIQLETRGSEVFKRRFTVAPDGKTLEVEIIPVVPAGESKTLRFTRASDQTASK